MGAEAAFSHRIKRTAIIVISVILGLVFAYTLHWFLSKRLLLPLGYELPVVVACLCLYAAAVLLRFRGEKRPKEDRLSAAETALYIFASGALPSVLLFHYVARNPANFNFSDCLLLCLLLAFLSATLYLLVSAGGDGRLALLPLLVLCGVFWGYPFVSSLYPSKAAFWILAAVFFGLSLALSFHFHLDRLTGGTLACVICLLFLYNFGSAALGSARASGDGRALFRTKTSFTVDDDAPHPDIYWFHMDGMMGFDETERLFGDDQAELKSALTARGFTINDAAALNVGWTTYALPALTSPSLYDSYIRARMEQMPDMNGAERKAALGEEALAIFNIYPQLELFHAFSNNRYDAFYIVYDIGRGMEKVPPDYRLDSALDWAKATGIVEMLSDYSLFSIWKDALSETLNKQADLYERSSRIDPKAYSYVNPDSDFSFGPIAHYDWVAAAMFEDALGKDSPKLVYFQNLLSHFPFQYDENGVRNGSGSTYDMRLYLPQQRYAAKVMLGMVDRVLQEDPDAVIVIQADHGVHGLYSREELEPQGYSNEEILAMNFSTVSAVRIPERYGALSEPLDPLDITRYLVNHFVGNGNYDYLYYHEEE